MRKILIITLIIFQTPLWADGAGGPDVTVKNLTSDSYQLTLKSKKVLQVDEAQQQLLPTASKLCEGKYPKYGKHEFRQHEPLAGQAANLKESFTLIQEISCVSEQPSQAAVKPSRALSSQHQTEIENTIRDLTRIFLENKERDAAKAFEMFTAEMKSMLDFKKWKKERRNFQKESGQLIDRDIWKITVYVDPPHAPQPGIYVAADYEASYKNMPVACGFIIWLEQQDGKYRVTREESGHLSTETVSRLSEAQLQQAKSQIGCRRSREVAAETQETAAGERAPDPSDSDSQSIGYPTVQAALEALRKDPDAKISEQAGWTIVQQTAGKNFVLWSFTPSSYPAYPAAIKRVIIEKEGGMHLEMQALCQASKEACDRLIEEFKALNNEMIKGLQKNEQ
jgi:hypothetical protein